MMLFTAATLTKVLKDPGYNNTVRYSNGTDCVNNFHLNPGLIFLDYLMEEKSLSQADAYVLCSMAVDVNITQLVDGNVGVHAMLPKSIFIKD